jgi:D-alanyl-D-alanine carboxypeptidase
MLTPPEFRLINGRELDAVPARLFKARSKAHARMLSHSDWLLRDKKDGAYIGVACANSMQFFQRTSDARQRIEAVAELFTGSVQAGQSRPIEDAEMILRQLDIDPVHYAEAHQLPLMAEPYVLEYAGKDRYTRPLWLEYSAKAAWLRMQSAGKRDNVHLQAISGYRSHLYQMGIFRRKMARGQSVADILTVNAAPGFSEHQSGRALDISASGEPAAEVSFELTGAYAWLYRFAEDFGFRLSYPRDNPHGISFEPWHWYHAGND